MRYVRACKADNEMIFEASNLSKIADGSYLNADGWPALFEDDIIEESDSIAELCDEFVVWHDDQRDKHGHYRGLSVIPSFEELRPMVDEYAQSKSIIIYAAIWTKEGLIYVAKMNDKGEFELL